MAKTPTPTRSIKTRKDVVAPMVVRDAAATPPQPAPPISEDERAQQIATRAYLLAEQRGFAPGAELDDWLAAERALDGALRRTPPGA